MYRVMYNGLGVFPNNLRGESSTKYHMLGFTLIRAVRTGNLMYKMMIISKCQEYIKEEL